MVQGGQVAVNDLSQKANHGSGGQLYLEKFESAQALVSASSEACGAVEPFQINENLDVRSFSPALTMFGLVMMQSEGTVSRVAQ